MSTDRILFRKGAAPGAPKTPGSGIRKGTIHQRKFADSISIDTIGQAVAELVRILETSPVEAHRLRAAEILLRAAGPMPAGTAMEAVRALVQLARQQDTREGG